MLVLAACSASSGGEADTVVLASSLNPSSYGVEVVFSVTVSSPNGTPTGAVTFEDNGAALDDRELGLTDGTASLSITTLSVLTHAITAVYSGNGHYAPNSSVATQQVVNIDATSLVLAVQQVGGPGSLVALQAELTPLGAAAGNGAVAPSGVVTVESDGTLVFAQRVAVSLDGVSNVFLEVSVPAGTHTFTASYAGDGNYAASTASPVTATIQ